MAKPLKLLIAFALGCLVTIAILWVAIANNLYLYKLVPFCVIGDVIVIAAVLAGTLISETTTYSGAHEEAEEEIGLRPHKSFKELSDEIKAIHKSEDKA